MALIPYGKNLTLTCCPARDCSRRFSVPPEPYEISEHISGHRPEDFGLTPLGPDAPDVDAALLECAPEPTEVEP